MEADLVLPNGKIQTVVTDMKGSGTTATYRSEADYIKERLQLD